MALPDRLATIHPTEPTLTIQLWGKTYPAIQELQGNSGCPVFFCGSYNNSGWIDSWLATYVHSNMPLVFAQSYPATDSLETFENFGGFTVYGYKQDDYAIRPFGTITPGYSGFNFTSNTFHTDAFIDGCYFGMRSYTFAGDPWVVSPIEDQYFGIQLMVQETGDFTGGTYSSAAANSILTRTVNVDQGENVLTCTATIVSPSIASTAADPEALVWAFPSLDSGVRQMFGIKIDAAGTVTSPIALLPESASNVEFAGVAAVCRDATSYHAILDAIDTSIPANVLAYAEVQESTYGSEIYSAYRPGFDDPDLPTYLEDLPFVPYTEAGRLFISCYGTDLGFLITYKVLNGATWEPKYLLVAKDWSTFQWVEIEPQNTVAENIVAQSLGGNHKDYHVSLHYHDGSYYQIGGTTNEPWVASSTEVVGGDTQDVRLRVWPFTLDGHEFAVFRLGENETLVYDLTTNTWPEWQSPGRNNWRAHVGQNWVGMSATTIANGFGSDVVAGDDTTGDLWILDPTAGRDDDPTTGDPVAFDRVVTGGIPLSGREVAPCGAVTLGLSLGSPTNVGATIELETSDDGGRNYQSHGTVTITQNDFDTPAEWRGLGQMRAPGRVFRFTDNGATVRVNWADLR